jgi:hypothetical protein
MEPFKSTPVSKAYAGMNYQEIKSHSSILTNERLAILFYMLDLNSMNLNTYYNENYLLRCKANLFQIYKNVRPLLRSNVQVRNAMRLDTKDPGIYTLDIAFSTVDSMIQYCTFHGFTYKKCYAITIQLNNIELMLRDTLQYFNYFFRPDWKQKPDVFDAGEKYKQIADKLTVEKLRSIVGQNHKIDFESLGISHDNTLIENDKQLENEDNELDDIEEEPEEEIEDEDEQKE